LDGSGVAGNMKIGGIVHRLETCPSTNDAARDLARAGEKGGTAVIARGQTSGRGTKGRAWHSALGKGLYVSFILRPRRGELTLLPLAAGVAAVEAVFRSEGFAPLLKWPNDIVWEGKKLGGILCESESLAGETAFAVLGIGLNLNHEEKDFAADIRSSAASLRMILGREVDVETVFRNLCVALDERYSELEAGKSAEIVDAFQGKLVFRPRQVLTLSLASGRVSGVFRGIDPRGGLMLGDNEAVRTYYSAEIRTVGGEK